MGGLLFFAPVTSRVSPRRATYFFCFAKKSKQKKASHVRAASRSLALLAAFGALANSLRSNSASAFIRTLLRCSARPNGGFEYRTARPLRELRLGCSSASRTSPWLLVRFANFALVARPLRELRLGCSSASRTSPWLLVRFANFALVARPLRELRLGCSSASRTSRGLGFPHFSTLTSRKGTARRATTPFKDSGRTQTSSFRAQSRNPCSPALQLGCCDYAQHDGVCRATLPPSPTPFPVLPHLPTMNS